MILYVDTVTRKLRRSVADSREVNSLQFKRGDSAEIQIVFVTAGVQVELASGTTITFGIKADGIFDGEFLVSTSDFTKSGSDATAVYTGNPSFNTTALNTALGVDLSTSNDIAKIKVGVEISWEDGGDSSITSTDTIIGYVFNDVIKGDEGSPTALSDASAIAWLAARGIVYDPVVTGLTGGGATKLDGLTTDGITVGKLQAVHDGNYLYVFKLIAGTDAENSPYIIRPDDYASSTNEKIWSLTTLRTNDLIVAGILSVVGNASVGGNLSFQDAFAYDNSNDKTLSLTVDGQLSDDRSVNWGDAAGALPIVPEYATLSAANAGEAAIGVCFWDTALKKLRVTTATS